MDVHFLDIVAYSPCGIGEIVVVDVGVSGVVLGCIGYAVLLLGDLVHGDEALLEACSEQHQHGREVGNDILGKPYGEAAGLELPYRTEYGFIA